MPNVVRSMAVNFAGLTFLPGISISNSDSAQFRGSSPTAIFGGKLADVKVDIVPDCSYRNIWFPAEAF